MHRIAIGLALYPTPALTSQVNASLEVRLQSK
jgi:hypothetical protein